MFKLRKPLVIPDDDDDDDDDDENDDDESKRFIPKVPIPYKERQVAA